MHTKTLAKRILDKSIPAISIGTVIPKDCWKLGWFLHLPSNHYHILLSVGKAIRYFSDTSRPKVIRARKVSSQVFWLKEPTVDGSSWTGPR